MELCLFHSFFVANPRVKVELFLKEELDFETTKIYDITITATDQGSIPRNDIAYVTIIVTDVNDNPTVFLPAGVTLTYCEDQAPANIYIGNINDLDSLDYFGLSVKIINPLDTIYDILDVDLTGIAAIKYYDVATNTISVIGTLSRAIYEVILSLVRYENTAKEFTGCFRYFSIYFETDSVPYFLDIDPFLNSTINSTTLVDNSELASIFYDLAQNVSNCFVFLFN